MGDERTQVEKHKTNKRIREMERLMGRGGTNLTQSLPLQRTTHGHSNVLFMGDWYSLFSGLWGAVQQSDVRWGEQI